MSKKKSGSPNGVDKDGAGRPFDSFDVQTMGLLAQNNGMNNGMPPVSNYMQGQVQGQMTMPPTTDAQGGGGGGGNSYQYPRYQRGGMPGEPPFTTEEDLLSSFDQQAGNVYSDFLGGGANSFQSHPGLFQGGDHEAKDMSEQAMGRGAPPPSAAPLMMPDPPQGMLSFNLDPENKELIRMQLQSQGLLQGSEGVSEQLYNMLERQALMPQKQGVHRPDPSSSRQLNMSAEQDQLGSSETDTPSTTPSNLSTPTGKNGRRPKPEEESSDSDCGYPPNSREAAGVSSTNGSSASGQGKVVPDEEKDETYWEKRRKNNESAKRSREARRHKEAQISMQVLMLEQENLRLRTELEMVTNDCDNMERELRQRQLNLKNGNQQRLPPTPRQVYDYSHAPPPRPPPSIGSNLAHYVACNMAAQQNPCFKEMSELSMGRGAPLPSAAPLMMSNMDKSP